MKEKISALLVLLVLPQLLFATIIRIPYDYFKIQEGIDAAVNGDTVWVDLGTYFEGINFRGKNILVTSNYIFDHNNQTIENTVIDGFYLHGQDTASVVCFVSGEDTSAVLNGFTIKRGQGTRTAPYDWYGGGIFCKNASPVISNNRVIENGFPMVWESGQWGGGIFVAETPYVKIVGNEISGNSVSSGGVGSGGGIFCECDSALFLENVISDNLSLLLRIMFSGDAYAGGIYFSGHSIVLQDNVIENNTCLGNRSAHGGGGYIRVDRYFLLQGNVISSNSISNSWGYMETEGAGLMLVGVGKGSISKNVVKGNYFEFGAYGTSGGGIKFVAKTADILSNRFENNEESGLRGTADTLLISRNVVWADSVGINCWADRMHLLNNTVVGTYEFGINAGVNANPETIPEVRNNIVVNCQSGPGIKGGGAYPPQLYYNDVWNNAGGNYQGLEPGEFDIHEDPLFVDPERGDFRLTEESPCIDAGDPDPQYNDPDGSRNDIGSFWLGYTPVSEIEVEILPKEFTLFQNYPNPFNATTRITYQLVNPLPSKVILEVYNLQGQRVKSLVDDFQVARIYELTWDGTTQNGSKVSSGVFIYTLSIDGNSTSKKMLFLK